MRIWLVHDKSSWMDHFRSVQVFKTQWAKTILKKKHAQSYAHACPSILKIKVSEVFWQ